MQILVSMEEKVLSLGKFSAVATGGKGGPYPPSWFTENTFFGTSCKVKTMTQKGIITFNSIYLIKVTYINSMLKVFKYRKFSCSSFKHQI